MQQKFKLFSTIITPFNCSCRTHFNTEINNWRLASSVLPTCTSKEPHQGRKVPIKYFERTLILFSRWLLSYLDGTLNGLCPWTWRLGKSQLQSKSFRVQTFVLGLRPVANIIWENPSTVPLLVFRDNEPWADFMIAWGDSSVWNSIPLRDICSETKFLICRNTKAHIRPQRATSVLVIHQAILASPLHQNPLKLAFVL